MSDTNQETKSACAIDDGHSSPQIDQLAKALSAAQLDMAGAAMDAKNPFFKSKYSSLGEIIKASKPALGKYGLAILPKIVWQGEKLSMRTLLFHSSGQWLDCGTLDATVKPDGRISPVQAVGSMITYLRRYVRSAVCQLYSDEDLDGNGHPDQTERSEVPSDASNVPSSVASEYLPTTPEQLWKPNQVPTPATRMWILNKLQAAPGQPNWAPLAEWLRSNKVISDSDTPQEWPLDLLPYTRTALEAIRSGFAKKG